MSFSNILNDFNSTFKLERGEDIRPFFVANKNSLREVVAAKVTRAAHYLKTGVLINEANVCKWADGKTDEALTDLFEGKAVKRKVVRHQHNMVIEEPSLFRRFINACKFFGEFLLHPTTVGAILPSSPGLAKEIVSEIPKDMNAEKRRILEVGPGTGIFTDKIIKRMNPGDELHLVEYDENFANALKEKYKHLEGKVFVHHESILDHKATEKYDFVVSGLPLNGFKADFVEKVFDKFTELTKPKSKISYFEYLGIPQIKMAFSKPEEKKNLQAILRMKKVFHEQNKKGVGHVYINAPCARVLHHEMKSGSTN
ncbi:MAG: methyltransferase domain-containing protein [Verrucomicrobia bacterium]|nr:methyltransferase domain-containing protein [Verrucomicrobiota bacterium]MBS0637882.1 methyltransferase domain-containing protein [Verrucomicrobiota bacterium]